MKDRCSLTILVVIAHTACERLLLGETAEFDWRHTGFGGILREQLKLQLLDDAREQEKKGREDSQNRERKRMEWSTSF